MTEPRLKTDLWIRAQIRLCDISFIPAVIGRKGDPDAGQVIIRRDLRNGTCELFARTILDGGGRGWRRLGGPAPWTERPPTPSSTANANSIRTCGFSKSRIPNAGMRWMRRRFNRRDARFALKLGSLPESCIRE